MLLQTEQTTRRNASIPTLTQKILPETCPKIAFHRILGKSETKRIDAQATKTSKRLSRQAGRGMGAFVGI